MTLIELLVSIMVIGAIVAVLAATVTVTYRQQADTQGRLDVARWGQSLAIWLPTDIASAAAVRAEPDYVDPLCTSPDCTFGSNALWLTWNDGSGPTTVSYRYGPAADGVSFILTRVECNGGGCTSRVVLRDLSGPVDVNGNPLPWTSGNAVPNEVIDVTVPLEVTSTTPGGPTVTGPTSAQRVIVNVNGMPGLDGAVRSSSVSFTAGGSSFAILDPTTYEPPQFLNANSGCGGPVTLIVDESASLSADNMTDIKIGVRSFVQALEGTPTQLQIITFHTQSRTLQEPSPGNKWNRFFDLSNPTEVTTLIGPTGTSGLVSNLAIGTGPGQGGTNWEDGLHRAFFKQNGDSYDVLPDVNAPMPELVVFFTDGVPTFDRQHAKSDGKAVVTVQNPPVPAKYVYNTAATPLKAYGNDFSPRGWYRAEKIVDLIRGRDPTIRLIGVGVGPAFIASTPVYRSGWPAHPVSGAPVPIPNSSFLGDLVVDQDPSLHGSISSGGATTRQYSSGTGWGDVSDADVLVTSDFAQFGSALTAIALAGCGGTLTVQTRDQAGDSVSADTTYQVGTKQVTTSAIAKAGTFDINLNGIASAEVVLLPPSSFDGTGYTAQSWGCRAAGADLVPGAAIPLGESGYRLMDAGNPLAGVGVTVSATNAVSCTLRLAP